MTAPRERTDETAEVAILLQRAGITLGEAEQAALVDAHRRNRTALDTLRAELSLAEEPAVTFEP